jgi:hypothetical protein
VVAATGNVIPVNQHAPDLCGFVMLGGFRPIAVEGPYTYIALLCIRARLQPCRLALTMNRASAPAPLSAAEAALV